VHYNDSNVVRIWRAIDWVLVGAGTLVLLCFVVARLCIVLADRVTTVVAHRELAASSREAQSRDFWLKSSAIVTCVGLLAGLVLVVILLLRPRR